MPDAEWTELEHLATLLDDLHHRRLFAERHDDPALLRQIDEEIAQAQTRRRRLLGRIRFDVMVKN